jgi:lipid-A-disaccharide synthase
LKYYIIAGETSGDLHGSNLIRELKHIDPSAEVRGVGGVQLKKNGVNLLFGLERLEFMGFYEVLKNLPTVRRNFREVKNDIVSFRPDLVILIDYPGFNLRMAKWCKQQGLKVAYYISPQIWAWNVKRVRSIQKYVDRVLCILPFEETFYKTHGYKDVHFVGHPLLDNPVISNHGITEKKQIVLLPGSRTQELKKMLPVMLEAAALLPDETFVIAGLSQKRELYLRPFPENVSLQFDNTYELLKASKAAVVCSGTATLETALFNVPQVVVYKTSWLNYNIAKRLAQVQYISLPNLIAGKKIVEELIQQDCNGEKIARALQAILKDAQDDVYALLRQKIGLPGAAQRAAELIYQLC